MLVRAACHVFLCALLLGGLRPSHAQVAPVQCNVSAAVPLVVRPEGISERVGDVVIACSGASAAAITGSLTVFFNTDVTSRLVSGSTSEALLLLDEPAPGSQSLGANVFEGTTSAPNALTFSNVPLYPASSAQDVHLLRLTNLRLNASALSSGAQILGLVTTSASLALSNPQQTLAFVSTPPDFSASAAGQCSTGTITLNFGESFEAEFRTRGPGQSLPGVVSFTESGFTPDPAIAGVGLADSGTLLSATISGLADGAQLSVPASVNNGTLTLTAVSPAGGGIVSAPGGSATIVYEVSAANPVAKEAASIGVAVSGVQGAISILGSLAPLSTDTGASASAPIPRFADRSIATRVSIASCTAVAAPTASLPVLAALIVLLVVFGAAAIGLGSSRR